MGNPKKTKNGSHHRETEEWQDEAEEDPSITEDTVNRDASAVTPPPSSPMDLTSILQWMEERRCEDEDHRRMEDSERRRREDEHIRQEEQCCQDNEERRVEREDSPPSPNRTPVTVSKHRSTTHSTHHEPQFLTKPPHTPTSTQGDRQPITYLTT